VTSTALDCVADGGVTWRLVGGL